MDKAEAAAAGSRAGPVLMVLMAMVVATVLGLHTTDLGDSCLGSSWFESDWTGGWSPSSFVKVDGSIQVPTVVTHLPWASLKENAQTWGTELGDELPQDGLPLPVLTCYAPPTRCIDIVSPAASCTRVVQRALCVGIGRECQVLVVTIEEPTECCCEMEERNTTQTGKVIKMWVRKTCSLPSDDTTGRRRGGKEEGRGRGGEPILSSEEAPTLPLLHEAAPNDDLAALDNTTSDRESERAEGAEGINEEHVKDTTVLEDASAALVFLFIGVVLVLIKSRVFRFTKKKLQQEDKDVESEETLMDETII